MTLEQKRGSFMGEEVQVDDPWVFTTDRAYHWTNCSESDGSP